MEKRFSRFFIDAPRWLLLFTLIWAPWAYGSTRTWTMMVLNGLMGAIIALWLIPQALRRITPLVHPVLLICVLFLIAQGWFMIWNAQYLYDRVNFKFVPIPCLWKAGPSALDRVDAIPAMIQTTGFLLIMAFVCDVATRPVWRMRIWWTIGWAAGSLLLFGLGREALGIKLIGVEGDKSPTAFALYYYRANAAAYINLALPMVAGLTLLAFRRQEDGVQRAIWPAVLLLCVAAAATAASKAGMVITAGILLALAFWEIWRRFKRAQTPRSHLLAFTTGALLFAGTAVAFGWHRAQVQLSRIPGILEEPTQEARYLVAQVCLRMMPDAGLWGMGPGNFAIAFPHYTNYLGDKLHGLWTAAHQDYLQTAVEWGWVGASVWSIILFGGIAIGLRSYLAGPSKLHRTDRTLIFVTVIALLGVAAHAAVDFPLQIASLQFYTATYLGLVWGGSRWSSRGDGRNLIRRPSSDHNDLPSAGNRA